MTRITLITLLLALMTTAHGTKVAGTPYRITSDALLQHIAVLAHDSLEGRETGEAGELKAAEYISKQFSEAGLLPAGPGGKWLQPYDFVKLVDFGPANRLAVNGSPWELGVDWEPLKQSVSDSFSFDEVVPVGYGITDEDGFWDDYEDVDVAGNAVLIKRYWPEDEENPHADLEKYSSLAGKILNAIDHDAAGVFFYTPLSHDDTMMSMGSTRVSSKEIPVIFLRRTALERMEFDFEAPQPFSMEGVTELIRVPDTGYNVLGILPGRSDSTIVIGAHYDHLGYGGPGSGSRYLGVEHLIHNGADDNGSGTSALLELAKHFGSRAGHMEHSVLFCAFSGEEKGLLGSSTFVKGPTVSLDSIRMMINMDMIGRLQNQDKGLAIFGTGTSEEFASFFDTLTNGNIKMTSKESGTGPSDHTSFYNREIPVLGFFTGAHQDYHKPEDDVEGIDADGILSVANLVTSIVNHFDTLPGNLTFQKTKDPDAGKRMGGFSVTLGIMPDYISEVQGLRIDGVSPDRPADRAGMLVGDIITQMGDYTISDIYEYMDALRKFRKGDTVMVTLTREEETIETEVVF
jgi:hypothetical protein